jgi:hypothetical protein
MPFRLGVNLGSAGALPGPRVPERPPRCSRSPTWPERAVGVRRSTWLTVLGEGSPGEGLMYVPEA